jgi:hypothetical protein
MKDTAGQLDTQAIRVTCEAEKTLPLDAIEEFQGKLKKRSKKDIAKIRASIEKWGFTFPFFIWKSDEHNYCLDGHGRIQALVEMRQEGIDLPQLPVVYIDAADDAEAKAKLLQLNSRYGVIDEAGLAEFIDGLDIDLSDFELDVNELSITGVSQTKEESVDYLVYGKNRIPITAVERDGLDKLLAEYTGIFGVNAGFVSRLIKVDNDIGKGLFFSEKLTPSKEPTTTPAASAPTA